MKTILVLAVVLPLLGCQQAPAPEAHMPAATPAPKPVAIPTKTTDTGMEQTAAPAKAWQVSVSPTEGGAYNIQVRDAQGKDIQVLKGPITQPPYTADNLITVQDYNADGWPDINARGLPVAASAISGEELFMYDPATKQFRKSDAFEQGGEIDIAEPGCISVEYRKPYNKGYAKDYYCWKNGAWKFKETKEL